MLISKSNLPRRGMICFLTVMPWFQAQLVNLPLQQNSFFTPSPVLSSFVETIPGTAVQFEMVPLPAGTISLNKTAVEIKPLWMHARQPGWTDMEWQLRNWLYFTWLSGDHIVEQHIHNIDVANWALQAHPVKAVGVGGRQVRVDPADGHIFDHFALEFEYPNGARVLSMCRQIDGTATRVNEYLIGTKGSADPSSWIKAAKPWRLEVETPPNPYVQEHTDLIASIRKGQPLNEGRQVAESTLSAIMGREAAYTGQAITWDEILNADLDITPKNFNFGPMPVPPVAVPGVTKLSRTA